jgi:flagellar basal-body rod modification protein FlgD
MSTSSTGSVTSTTTAAAAQSQVNNGLAELSSNYQQFLTLLTTQLQNQDPLSPMDTNQFTQQLVEMSGVQQQLLANNLLTTLVAQGQGGLSNGVSYIGKSVTSSASTATLTNGAATWNYTLPSAAASVQATVTDSTGAKVWSGTASGTAAGANSFTWNGKTTSGTQLVDGGAYTLTLVAKDGAGNTLNAQTQISGTVTAATLSNGTAYLSIGNNSVPLSSVTSVQ